MGQVGSGLCECLLRDSAFGYVLNRTDNLGPPIAVLGPMGDRAYVLDRTVWHPQPDLVIEGAVAAGPRPLDLFRQQREVIRVDSRADPLKGHGGIAVQLVDAI